MSGPMIVLLNLLILILASKTPEQIASGTLLVVNVTISTEVIVSFDSKALP
jgi:hypothetical protein